MNEIVNNLKYEKSPYLLQHQNNPVNWYAWGDDAFTKAKNEDKPIFLSIGYSTCHWCHVMAHESFEDEQVARYLNEHFISIKVDREERPDIDSTYMDVCQALTGSGGWPLSVFIDYDKRPIYAGTYYPKATFLMLLRRIVGIWQKDRDNVNYNAEKIIDVLSQTSYINSDIDLNLADKCYQQLENAYDTTYGGFHSAPKFPTPHNLLFLMKYYQCKKNKHALKMVVDTLIHMRNGGIYDHIGFGFSRYSTDRKWLIPHFEKMLYDNVLLMVTYSEAFKITHNYHFQKTVDEIVEYLTRKMLNENGGFYTAEDADSEGEEGRFYIFTKSEIEEVLGEDAPLFCKYYNIINQGYFEEANIPNLIGRKVPDQDLVLMEQCRQKLFLYQDKRVHPHKDDKILTSLNGLAIAAFAIAGRILNNNEYIEIAKKTVAFIKSTVYIDDKLYARYREGEVKNLGFADDYAYVIWGLIELYQTTFDDQYLRWALELNHNFIDYFYDKENGGFFINDYESETILYRKKEIYDGATPSANAVAINNLYRLAGITKDEKLYNIAEESFHAFATEINSQPMAHTFSCLNVLLKNFNIDVTIVADKQNEIKDMLNVLRHSPFINIAISRDSNNYQMLDNKPTAYICKGTNCLPPTTNLDKIATII